MEKIKVLIVEDKVIIAEDLALKLSNHGMEIVGICDAGEDAIQLNAELNPDLILMDIELSGAMDGISAAQIIHNHCSVPIIYLSDYTDSKTVDRAKKTLPVCYLAKPIQESELVRQIDIAFYNATHKSPTAMGLLKDHVFLRTDSQIYLKLALDEILYLQASRSYCEIITKDKIHTLTKSMNHIQEQINSKDFVRVHRSFVINVNKISAIDGHVIHLGDREVQMSREYKDDLIGRLKFIR